MSDEIGGFLYIGRVAYPLVPLKKKDYEKALKDYEGLRGIPHSIYVHEDDKFHLFPYPTNDWQLRFFATNNKQIQTSCFKCEKQLIIELMRIGLPSAKINGVYIQSSAGQMKLGAHFERLINLFVRETEHG